MKYQVEVKQLVRFPYCRIYRTLIDNIVGNPKIRKRGGLLFSFAVLFALANYRTSYRSLEGTKYVIGPGEWVARYSELAERLGTRFPYQTNAILNRLQEMHLIEVTQYPRQKLVRFKICCWADTNTHLDYNAPCQKDTGFFFFPIAMADEILAAGHCCEADLLLDLWLHTVYHDPDVSGSELGPVVYFRNGSQMPLLHYADLAARWGVSKSTVCRAVQKFEELELLGVVRFPGNNGAVLYLKNYLSTMFLVSDLVPSLEKLAIVLHIDLPDAPETLPAQPVRGAFYHVAEQDEGVANPNIRKILENVRKALYASGLRCTACPHSLYQLSLLSDCEGRNLLYDLAITCSSDGPKYAFSLSLKPLPEQDEQEVN